LNGEKFLPISGVYEVMDRGATMSGEIMTTEAFLAQLATLVKNMGANGHKEPKKPRTTPALKAERMAANDAECIKVFTEAGYKDVQPRINVLTFGKWLAVGRRVREEELLKGLQVAKFTLFHISQTEDTQSSE
jgi:hypothetical protein